MTMIKISIIMFFLALLNYFLIVMVVDCILMGKLHYKFSRKCDKDRFVITKQNRIDIQSGYKCSAFSVAYVFRHWGIEENGNNLYKVITGKMESGYVYPKGIQKLFLQYGFKVKYCRGSIDTLKNEVSMGNPVIVMIRTRPDEKYLHYVPVVGYDEQNIFVAESLEEFVNCNEQFYNRKIPVSEFKKLWNTRNMEMPFYKNTYIKSFYI